MNAQSWCISSCVDGLYVLFQSQGRMERCFQTWKEKHVGLLIDIPFEYAHSLANVTNNGLHESTLASNHMLEFVNKKGEKLLTLLIDWISKLHVQPTTKSKDHRTNYDSISYFMWIIERSQVHNIRHIQCCIYNSN